jgi:hypothetical protein
VEVGSIEQVNGAMFGEKSSVLRRMQYKKKYLHVLQKTYGVQEERASAKQNAMSHTVGCSSCMFDTCTQSLSKSSLEAHQGLEMRVERGRLVGEGM